MSYTKRLFLSLILMAAAIAAVALTRAPTQASGTSSLVARYLPRYASAPNCVRTFQLYGDTGTGKVRFCSVVGTPGTWNDLVAGSSAGISSLNGLTGATQTFSNDTNVTISSSGTAHTVGWSGSLAVSRGGTGTGTAFTQGSIVFAGASGVYGQDNAKLFWDDTNDSLGVGTTTPGVINGTNFASVVKFHLKPGAASSYIVNDSTTAGGLLINLSDSSADNRLWAVYASRAGTERLAFAVFSDAGSPNEYWFITRGGGHFLAGTDNTHDIGASGATRPRSIYAGTSVVTPVAIVSDGSASATALQKSGAANVGLYFNSNSLMYSQLGFAHAGFRGNQFTLQSEGYFAFTSGDANSSIDTALYRNAAGVIEVNNGSAGTFRDLKLRGLQHTTGTRPTCDSSTRGTTWYVAGGGGVKDTFEVCAKDVGDAYAWRTIY